MREPIVIVGAGPVAAQAVTSIRQLGYAGDIVVIGDEPHPPYQRPPLSKAYLSGEFALDRLALKGKEFYEKSKVDLRIGDAAVAVDAAGRSVDTARGKRVPYDKLLIATGARARQLTGPAASLGNVHVIRSIADADRLAAVLAPGSRLTVVGGGYVGLETASKARSLGVEVTVIEAAPRLLQRVVSPEVSAFFDELHASRGVKVLKGRGVAELEGSERVTAVVMSDGERIATDNVLVAVGSLPNVEFAAAAGLELDHGILVDETTASSVPGIYAAGDVTRFPSRLYGRRIRLESVQNATDQAKAAAAAMLGQKVFYDPMPWFWSDQYEIKLQIAGLSDGHDTVTTVREGPGPGFSVDYVRDGRLIAVDSINAAKSHMLARRRIVEAHKAAA